MTIIKTAIIEANEQDVQAFIARWELNVEKIYNFDQLVKMWFSPHFKKNLSYYRKKFGLVTARTVNGKLAISWEELHKYLSKKAGLPS